MANKCFTCGINFDEAAILRRYSDIYKSKGIEFYYYRESAGKPLIIIEANHFNKDLKDELDTNKKKGAEYEHIKEFR